MGFAFVICSLAYVPLGCVDYPEYVFEEGKVIRGGVASDFITESRVSLRLWTDGVNRVGAAPTEGQCSFSVSLTIDRADHGDAYDRIVAINADHASLRNAYIEFIGNSTYAIADHEEMDLVTLLDFSAPPAGHDYMEEFCRK